jgi:hypothetical protein
VRGFGRERIAGVDFGSGRQEGNAPDFSLVATDPEAETRRRDNELEGFFGGLCGGHEQIRVSDQRLRKACRAGPA